MAFLLRISGVEPESIVDGPGFRYVVFTLSGGEPFCQAEGLCDLGRRVKAMGKDLMVYSGYTLEQLLEKGKREPAVPALLRLADTLVDGPYIEALRDLTLEFRGSSNQRILHLRDILPAEEP